MSPNRDHEESKLDETIEETFPASDPPANTVETGIHAGPPNRAAAPAVSDNPAARQLQLTVDGHTAFLAYERARDTLTIVHTEVPKELRGRHFGETLVDAALAMARDQRLRPIVVCPFARTYLRRHPPRN